MGLSKELSCETGSVSCHHNPHWFLLPDFETFFFCAGTLGCVVLSRFPVVPPGLSAHDCGTDHSARCCLPWSTSHHLAVSLFHPGLPVSAPPTCLDECFFFNSLVAGLPYSLTFCQFRLFFVSKFVAVLLLVVQGGKVYIPMPSPWLIVLD